MVAKNERLGDRESTPEHGAAATLSKEAIKHYQPKRLDRPDLAKSAVLVPVVSVASGDRIIVTARHETLRFQPGNISFPGGKAEPTESDLLLCALREAEEEIGLPPSAVEVLGELDQVTVAARYLVTPFVGLIAPTTSFAPGIGEVARMIDVDVVDLLHPGAFETTTEIRDGATRPTYKFRVGTIVIWGATARILVRLLQIGYGACYPDVPAS